MCHIPTVELGLVCKAVAAAIVIRVLVPYLVVPNLCCTVLLFLSNESASFETCYDN